jgi:hypothetical protein
LAEFEPVASWVSVAVAAATLDAIPCTAVQFGVSLQPGALFQFAVLNQSGTPI